MGLTPVVSGGTVYSALAFGGFSAAASCLASVSAGTAAGSASGRCRRHIAGQRDLLGGLNCLRIVVLGLRRIVDLGPRRLLLGRLGFQYSFRRVANKRTRGPRESRRRSLRCLLDRHGLGRFWSVSSARLTTLGSGSPAPFRISFSSSFHGWDFGTGSSLEVRPTAAILADPRRLSSGAEGAGGDGWAWPWTATATDTVALLSFVRYAELASYVDAHLVAMMLMMLMMMMMMKLGLRKTSSNRPSYVTLNGVRCRLVYRQPSCLGIGTYISKFNLALRRSAAIGHKDDDK